MDRSAPVKSSVIALIASAIVGMAWGQTNPNHVCDGTCEHQSGEALASYPIADPAALTALFELEEGSTFDVQIFAETLLAVEASGWSFNLNELINWWLERWADGRWAGTIRNKIQGEGGLLSLAIELEGGGIVHFARNGESWEGRLAFPNASTEAWVVRGDAQAGTINLHSLTSLQCSVDANGVPAAGLPPITTADAVANAAAPEDNGLQVAEAAGIYNSYPGANGVIYLDFDGETVSGKTWNSFYTVGADIVAEPATFTSAQIESIYKTVAEDYRPFNVNVTTDRAVFDTAPINRRVMVIFTPTNEWYGASGGVAFVGTFGSSFYDEPAWVFTDQLLHNDGPHAPYAAEAASHEAGHTLGLNHDGSSTGPYYSGHGSGATSWAPIMGASYLASVSQWSRGEYPDANNLEDDLAIIAAPANGLGFRSEDDTLIGELGGSGAAVSGVIESEGDADLFTLDTSGGSLVVDAANEAVDPNLDIHLRLFDASSQLVAEASPEDNLDASLQLSELTAGIYYLEVSGTGSGDLVTGYSGYGSLGAYTLTAKYADGSTPVDVAITSPQVSSIALSAGSGLVLEGTVGGGTPEWSVLSAPAGGSATLSDPNSLSTFCTFAGDGVYQIQLQATQVTNSEVAVLQVSVGSEDVNSPDLAPTLSGADVNLGPDFSFYGDQVVLSSGIEVVSPDMVFTWIVLSGQAVISEPYLPELTLRFLAAEQALVRLIVDRNGISTYSEVTVTAEFFENELAGNTLARALVPVNSSLDGLWQQRNFDDSSWQSGTPGAGYSAQPVDSDTFAIYSSLIGNGLDLQGQMHGKAPACYLRVPFTLEAPQAVVALDLDMQYDDGFVAYLNGTEVARANVSDGGAGLLITDDFSSGNYTGGNGWPAGWSELSDDGNPTSGDVFITNGELHLQRASSGAVRSINLSNQVSAELSFRMQTFENGNDTWKVEANGGDGWVTVDQIDPIGGPGPRDVVERNETRSYQLENFIPLTANVQIRFVVVQGYAQIGIQYLRLDDIRIETTGTPLAWNSTAASDRPDGAALAAETYRLAVPPGLLVTGTNMLAIHGLNSSAALSDDAFVLKPQLKAIFADLPVFNTVAAIGDASAQGFWDDPDGDGMTNLIEHATGNDPEGAEVGLLKVRPGTLEETVEVHLRLPVTPPEDVRYQILCRNHLLDPWTIIASKDGTGAWSGVQPAPPIALGTSHVIHAFPQAELEAGFYKLQVSLIAPQN